MVESEWLFHPDTLADPASNIQDAIEFWDLTNRQDWDIVARSQLGIGVAALCSPGPIRRARAFPPPGTANTCDRWAGCSLAVSGPHR